MVVVSVRRAKASCEANVAEIDRDEHRVKRRRVVRLTNEHTTLRRHHDAGHVLVVRDVMGSWSVACDLYIIVVPAQQSIVTEIEDLLGAVRGDVRWELHLEAPPGLVLLLPRLDLGDFESGPGQGEGDGQIGPHRIACEVDKMQIIPRGLQGMASESGTGIGALLDDRSFGGLNRNALRCEGRALVRKLERRE